MKIFENAADFRKSLEMRLLKQAQVTGIDLQRIRKQVAFERFLARLFRLEHSPWILKGGHAMELRLKIARATQDIDLFVKTHTLIADQQMILERLQDDGNVDLSDFFEYRISFPETALIGPPYGGFRFPVESRIAARTFEKFHLDVGIGDICFQPFERIKGKDWLDFCGIPAPVCLVISVEQQFAEKIHAYSLPREQGYNSRVKDLVDMALLIQYYEMDHERIVAALQQTYMRRGTHELPDTLNNPPEEWNSTFEALAKQCDLDGDISTVFASVHDFYERALKTKIEPNLNSNEIDFPSVIVAMNQDQLKGTPLYNILKRIIKNGENVNQKTSNGHHFLQLLIKANLERRQKLELVKLSVEHGANVASPDTSTLTPFATAVSIGDKEIADFLHSKGASKVVPLSLGTQYYHLYRQFPL